MSPSSSRSPSKTAHCVGWSRLSVPSRRLQSPSFLDFHDLGSLEESWLGILLMVPPLEFVWCGSYCWIRGLGFWKGCYRGEVSSDRLLSRARGTHMASLGCQPWSGVEGCYVIEVWWLRFGLRTLGTLLPSSSRPPFLLPSFLFMHFN